MNKALTHSESRPAEPDMSFEHQAREAGYTVIAGVDEAGRGPLAGAVVAGAVILPSDGVLPAGLKDLNDSKKLNEKKRAALYELLTELKDIVGAVGVADVDEIDRLNILNATHLAMARAVANLTKNVDFCLVDGLPVKGLSVPHQAIVKGDARCLSIAAASILAKVYRDRLMEEADLLYPQYGFAQHKGYGTRAHLEALRKYGPCPLHRRSFGPVAQMELPIFG